MRIVASGICRTDIDFCDERYEVYDFPGINRAMVDARRGGTIKFALRR